MEPLWADLINSDWHDHLGSGRTEDRLGNDAWLERYLARTVWREAGLPDAAGRGRLRALRGLLRRLTDAVLAREALAEADLAALAAYLEAAPVLRRLLRDGEAWRVELAAPRGGLDDVLGEIAGTFAAMLAAGEADRVKVCENPDCGWIILDRSRNRSRRWCEASDCGNVMKVRRFRERHRGQG